MKNQSNVTVRISDELLGKIALISEREGRSLNNQFLLMVRNSIAYFEKTHGKISASELQAALSHLDENSSED